MRRPPIAAAGAIPGRRRERRAAASRGGSPERHRALALPADRRLRVPVGLPHRRARGAGRLDRLAVRAAVRRAQRLRQPARPPGGLLPLRALRRSTTPSARAYEPGTNVLVTTWKTPSGWVVVRDALTMGPGEQRGPGDAAHPPAGRRRRRPHAGAHRRMHRGPGRDRAGLRAGRSTTGARRPSGRCSTATATRPTRPAADQTIRLRSDLALGIEGDRVGPATCSRPGERAYCALSWADGARRARRRRRRRGADRRHHALLARLAGPGAHARPPLPAIRSSARRSRSRA